ncbi:MAG: hypothetical protein FJ388_13840 [Verrucomicrobia bacterium]|nr:hypothetical protein [Verrucomicrobiota bacterium]
MSTTDPREMLRRHERVMAMLFVAFAASVVVLGAIGLSVDVWWPERERLAEEESRSLAVVLFSLGVLHVFISALIRVFAPARLEKPRDPLRVAQVSRAVAILACVLCETPALFGLVYMLLGGGVKPAAFFMSFALTCIAAHYATRIRPAA